MGHLEWGLWADHSDPVVVGVRHEEVAIGVDAASMSRVQSGVNGQTAVSA